MIENSTIVGVGCCIEPLDLENCLCIGENVNLPNGAKNKILINIGRLTVEGDIPEGFAKAFGDVINRCVVTWGTEAAQ